MCIGCQISDTITCCGIELTFRDRTFVLHISESFSQQIHLSLEMIKLLAQIFIIQIYSCNFCSVSLRITLLAANVGSNGQIGEVRFDLVSERVWTAITIRSIVQIRGASIHVSLSFFTRCCSHSRGVVQQFREDNYLFFSK